MQQVIKSNSNNSNQKNEEKSIFTQAVDSYYDKDLSNTNLDNNYYSYDGLDIENYDKILDKSKSNNMSRVEEELNDNSTVGGFTEEDSRKLSGNSENSTWSCDVTLTKENSQITKNSNENYLVVENENRENSKDSKSNKNKILLKQQQKDLNSTTFLNKNFVVDNISKNDHYHFNTFNNCNIENEYNIISKSSNKFDIEVSIVKKFSYHPQISNPMSNQLCNLSTNQIYNQFTNSSNNIPNNITNFIPLVIEKQSSEFLKDQKKEKKKFTSFLKSDWIENVKDIKKQVITKINKNVFLEGNKIPTKSRKLTFDTKLSTSIKKLNGFH
jgi:hypothetical protein